MRLLVPAVLVVGLLACSKKEEAPPAQDTSITSAPVSSPMVEKGDAKDGGAPVGITADPRALPAGDMVAPGGASTTVTPNGPVDLAAAGANPFGLAGGTGGTATPNPPSNGAPGKTAPQPGAGTPTPGGQPAGKGVDPNGAQTPGSRGTGAGVPGAGAQNPGGPGAPGQGGTGSGGSGAGATGGAGQGGGGF